MCWDYATKYTQRDLKIAGCHPGAFFLVGFEVREKPRQGVYSPCEKFPPPPPPLPNTVVSMDYAQAREARSKISLLRAGEGAQRAGAPVLFTRILRATNGPPCTLGLQGVTKANTS